MSEIAIEVGLDEIVISVLREGMLDVQGLFRIGSCREDKRRVAWLRKGERQRYVGGDAGSRLEWRS